MLKPRLRSVVIFRLKSISGSYFTLPVVHSAIEYFGAGKDEVILNCEILEIWVFERSIGKVWSRFKFHSVPKAVDSETDTLLAKARTLIKNGQDDEAMATLRRVLVSEPMSAESYLLLGKIHLRRGDLEQAISSFKTSVFWDNRLVEAHVDLGKIYVEKGDCMQAKTYAASAAEIAPDDQEVIALQRLSERCSK